MVAALFALHPINVESVAWIAERKNLLSMLFFLLALGSYRWYAREPKLGRYAVVAFLFALGLLAKPQVITFPFVLLLWDYWPLQRMMYEEPRVRKSSRCSDSRQKSFLARAGEAPAVCTFRGQRSHHYGRRPHRHREDLVSPAHSHRGRDCFLRAISRQGGLAFAAGSFLSPSRKFSATVARIRGIVPARGHHSAGLRSPQSPLSFGGLALVRGYVGADAWPAAGGLQGHAGHRRSLRVSAVHRAVHHDLLGSGISILPVAQNGNQLCLAR